MDLVSELNKRIFTSIILSILLILSFYNDFLLSFILLLILYQLYFEFYNIFNKIFLKNKIKLYLILLCNLFFITTITLYVWLAFTNSISNHKTFLLLIFTITISSDIGGYIFGKLFKGKKLTRISPNKTYSGLIGAYFLSLIFTYLIFNKFYNFEFIILLSLIISSISQSGDIFISYLKRKANLKNTGNILPGHGGLLDRLDGVIFSIPAGYVLINLL